MKPREVPPKGFWKEEGCTAVRLDQFCISAKDAGGGTARLQHWALQRVSCCLPTLSPLESVVAAGREASVREQEGHLGGPLVLSLWLKTGFLAVNQGTGPCSGNVQLPGDQCSWMLEGCVLVAR